MTASSTTDRMTSHGAPDAGTREINIAHSPDSDDAFMFYGLATNKVRVPGLRFTHTLCDIETLNRKAQEGVYDVTAISFHAFPYIQDHYALFPQRRQRRRWIRADDRRHPSAYAERSKKEKDRSAGQTDHRVSCVEALRAGR